MAVSAPIPYLPEDVPLSVQLIITSLILVVISFIYSTLTSDRPCKQFPTVALTEKDLSPKASWFKDGKNTVLKGVKIFSGPFQVITGTGSKFVLPNRFADELKSDPRLSSTDGLAKDFFPSYSGFEPLRLGEYHTGLLQDLVRDNLTQSLGLITGDLVEETTAAVHDLFGDDVQWHETLLKQKIAGLVARLSSRVFLGKDLCRDPHWLDIAKNYTVDTFVATRLLRKIPALVRPAAHWVLPSSRKVRKDYRDAQKLISAEVEKRKDRAQKALEAGQKPPKTADTIGWMYEIAQERQEDLDYVAAQMSLILAALYFTTEAITQAMLDICAHPEIIQPLREEAIKTIGDEGWSKTALYKLRLMDSFLKESQRVHPPNLRKCSLLLKVHQSQ